MPESRYSEAGVNIQAGMQAAALMQARTALDTRRFAHGLAVDTPDTSCQLAVSTDGVGTKTLLAAELGRLEGLGADLVNHCVNDLLAVGAEPLMFVDYIGMHRIQPETAACLVESMSQACRVSGCVLVGGETAEMPDVYRPDTFELVGTLVGRVPAGRQLPQVEAMQAGDVLIGLPSSGPHTNGYTLIRSIMARRDCQAPVPGTTECWSTALLRPHRSYRTELEQLWTAGLAPRGIAHITGGGFPGNVGRLLPGHLGAVIDTRAWEPPALFRHLVAWGNMTAAEAYQVFNMGMGMVLVCASDMAPAVLQALPDAAAIGCLETGAGVRLQ